MLTERQCRDAKAKGTGYRLADHAGLALFVTPKGLKAWRYRFRVNGKEQTLSLGTYPEINLKDARARRDDARRQLDKKRDPRRSVSVDAENSFQAVVARWHSINAPRWDPIHCAFVLRTLRDVLDVLGKDPINKITGRQVLDELRKGGSVYAQHRARGYLSSVFAFAIAEGLCDRNPGEDIKAAMPPMKRVNHRAAVTTIEEARQVLQQLDSAPAHPTQRLASRLLALTLVRPGRELASARWEEFADGVWTIPARRMKMRRPHIVPLSRQATDVLDAARVLTGRGELVFPNASSMLRPMSELDGMFRRAGLQGRHSPHGWRSTFSTVMHERFPQDHAAIEMTLAHSESGAKGKVSSAYNRSAYMERRRDLLQEWADELMVGLCAPIDLLNLPRKTRRR